MYDSFLVRWARHNPGLLVALVLCFVLAGCAFFPFKAASPTDPARQVTRSQLNAEIVTFEESTKASIAAFYAKAKAADADLTWKETLATAGLQELTKLANETGFPIPAAATGLLTLLVGGLAYDNRRKDTKLLLANASGQATQPTTTAKKR